MTLAQMTALLEVEHEVQQRERERYRREYPETGA